MYQLLGDCNNGRLAARYALRHAAITCDGPAARMSVRDVDVVVATTARRKRGRDRGAPVRVSWPS
jgi:hypothetical protein